MRRMDIGPRRGEVPVIPQIKIEANVPAKQARKKIWPKILVATALLILVLVLVLAFYVLPEARVEVVARTEPVARDFEIRVDKNIQEPNAAELAIGGKIFVEEIEGSRQQNATGVKNIGRKASGFVYIYNFTKTTLILKANTTRLTIGGREYFFTQDASGIRPTAMIGLSDPEVDETSLVAPIPVAAAVAGTEYNLPKGARLEITNEVLGSNPETLYATVAEDISGGTTKEVKIVTETDINTAHQSLSGDLIQQAKQLLTTKYGLTALDNAMAADALEPKSTRLASEEAASFSVSQTVRVKAFAFNKDQARDVVLQRINRLLPQNKILDQEEGMKFEAQFANVSVDAGLGLLVARFDGQLVYVVNKEDLINKLKGKTVLEMKEVLFSRPEIESARIKFYPFWVKRAPKIASKIKLEIVNE